MKVKTRLAMIPILVGDQEGALHFYTEKLGLEKRSDLSFGPGLRLLTVAPRGQRRPEIALVQPDMLVTSVDIPAQQGAQKVCWVFRTDDTQHTFCAPCCAGISTDVTSISGCTSAISGRRCPLGATVKRRRPGPNERSERFSKPSFSV